jgi:Tfp pilus assembly protein PilF
MYSSRFSTVVSIFVFILSGYCSASYGQSGVDYTGNGGLHTIQGRVYLPNGRALDTSIVVKLESTNHSTQSVYTDRNGAFSFRALSPGNYSVVVNAGESFLTAREYFTIDPEIAMPGRPRIVTVPKVFNAPIYLQFKPNVAHKNEVLNAKLASVPKEAIEHCQKGMELERAGKTSEAIKEFRQAIAIYPQFAIPYTELGKIYIRSGKIDEAVRELSLAIRFDPTDFESRLNYGIALFGRRDLQDAEKELRGAAELDKTAVTPHYYLGLLFVQNRNLDDAQKSMETARLLKGEKEFPLVHKYLGGIYWGKKQYLQAADELEKYVTLVPDAKDADQTRKTILDLRSRHN